MIVGVMITIGLITLDILVGCWSLTDWRERGNVSDLVFAVIYLVLAVVLAIGLWSA